MNWLDTETKAILQGVEESKLAPPKVAEFALVLIHKGVERERLVRAVCRINDCSQSQATELVCRRLPVIINSDLTEEDATLGQFELICCDAIAAVIRSEVAEQGEMDYLLELFQRVSRSPEFKPAMVRIDEVPINESGLKFVDQFLGMELQALKKLGFPRRFKMPAKKARIMKHWAARVGAKVSTDAD